MDLEELSKSEFEKLKVLKPESISFDNIGAEKFEAHVFYSFKNFLVKIYENRDKKNITLIQGVNFSNISQAAFAPISFCQKITNPYCKHIQVALNTFISKKLFKKSWWNWLHVGMLYLSNIFAFTLEGQKKKNI